MKECKKCNIVCEEPLKAVDPDHCYKCGASLTEQD